MDSREQFEQTIAKKIHLRQQDVAVNRKGDSYRAPYLAKMWDIWQQARASIEVPLPADWAGVTLGMVKRDKIRGILTRLGLTVTPAIE